MPVDGRPQALAKTGSLDWTYARMGAADPPGSGGPRFPRARSRATRQRDSVCACTAGCDTNPAYNRSDVAAAEPVSTCARVSSPHR